LQHHSSVYYFNQEKQNKMAKRLISKSKKVMLTVAFVLVASLSVMAQEESKWEITPSADLVSSYVWRGLYQASTAFQPGLTIGYGGLSLGAWGSTDFTGIGKEVDFTLGYSAGGVNIGVTDYWWSGEGSKYGDYKANHAFEGTIGYNFGESFPLSLSWSTFFAGGLDKVTVDDKGEAEQSFSTYISAGYDFNVKGVDVTAAIGVSPWEGLYTDDFAVSTISLRATKEIKFSDSFSLPVFAETIVAPNQDNVFLVFGISF
jgi:hypothetical protein